MKLRDAPIPARPPYVANDGFSGTHMVKWFLERAARVLPGRVASTIDRLRPSLASGFGGPFNGQERRMEAVRDLVDRVPFKVLFETGTYRATTTVFLRQLSKVPIATIETQARYYHYAKHRLRDIPNVTLMRGDSPTILQQISGTPPWNLGPAFFYLDAHWLKSLPLLDELQAIREGWPDYAVLIDDFQVPNDPGYAYDDYGQAAVLSLPLLTPFGDADVVVYWPTAHSSTETGARRGWVVLATTGLVDSELHHAKSLSRGGDLASVLRSPDPWMAKMTIPPED